MRIDKIQLSGSLLISSSLSRSPLRINDNYLYINPQGNIGIGTTNPTSKLVVTGSVAVKGQLRATTLSGSFTGSIKLPTIPLGTSETNIVLVNGGGGLVYRSNLSLTGAQGTQGTQGTQGFQGTQGTQGIQGTAGTQGFQGNQGPQGNQGIQGTVGTQGFQGNQGAQGNQGIQGTVGTQGFQGRQGPQGNQGSTGVQGTNGTVGTQGFQGNQGAQGNQGIQGTVGTQGVTGAQGLTGATGATGGTGPQGAAGPVNVYSVTFDASYITPPVDYTITHNLGLSGNFKNIVITVHGIQNGNNRIYYANDYNITSYSSNSFVFRLATGNWNMTQTVSISLVRS